MKGTENDGQKVANWKHTKPTVRRSQTSAKKSFGPVVVVVAAAVVV